MNYQTYKPHPDLQTIIKCYWTLEVPAQDNTQRQLILPDGCVDMCFILGDDIKRYTGGDQFIIQPRQMLLGQITDQFYIEPTGYVNTFAVRFYPYGFANFINVPLHALSNKETPLNELFGTEIAEQLSREIIQANSVNERIEITERFLFGRLSDKVTIENIVKSTIDAMVLSNGNKPLNALLKGNVQKRRQIEREFKKKIGVSPKQLCKAIRLQATLRSLLNQTTETLTDIAYENEYYDQSHFIKDFKEFTGITPKEFLADDKMTLSALLYKRS
ncbi:MAG TPA: helix-turn-helix domain-containing protein [Ohtaekwangia sp.]|nr:helix-turn-helix domain-containing protein [Ohtaekwangia sp.]